MQHLYVQMFTARAIVKGRMRIIFCLRSTNSKLSSIEWKQKHCYNEWKECSVFPTADGQFCISLIEGNSYANPEAFCGINAYWASAFLRGSVAEWLGCWSSNPKVLGSNPGRDWWACWSLPWGNGEGEFWYILLIAFLRVWRDIRWIFKASPPFRPPWICG